MAHRVISLLRNDYGALGVKRTSTTDATSRDSAARAAIPTMCSGNTGA